MKKKINSTASTIIVILIIVFVVLFIHYYKSELYGEIGPLFIYIFVHQSSRFDRQ